jgi:hypothetical protein
MSISRGLRIINLPQRDYSASGNPTVDMDTIVKDHRVHHVEFELSATITQNGAAALVTGDKLAQLVSRIQLGKRADGSGVCWRILDQLMTGFEPSLVADVPATNAYVAKRDLRLVVPFADFSARSPEETMVLTDLIRDQSPIVTFADFASLFATFSTLTGKLNTKVYCEPLGERQGTVAPIWQGQKDLAGQNLTMPMKGRRLEYLFLMKKDGANFTSAEVSEVELKVDGEQLYSAMNIGQLARMYNRARGLGGGQQTLSATAPVGREALNDQQDPSNGGSGWTLPFIPLFVPPRRYKRDDLPIVEQGIDINTKGSLSGFTVGYRVLEVPSEGQIAKANAKRSGK